MTSEQPIQNVDHIDIIGKRVDGGVDLIIVASGPIDGSVSTLAALEQKIRNYISEIGSSRFRGEYGPMTDAQARICVVCEHEIDNRAQKLIERLVPVANVAGVALEARRSMPVPADR